MRESRVEKNGYDNSWRVTFTVIPAQVHVPTEIRCRLFPHASVTRVRADLDQLRAPAVQPPAAGDLAKDDPARNQVPAKEKALADLLTRPLTETWTYTLHQ